MKILIISNFRTGSWYLHDTYVKEGYMPLGEIGSNLHNDRKIKIEKFKTRLNVVGKLHPNQLESNNLNDCYRLCEIADEIVYIQRKDTRQQVISFAVAMTQFDKQNTSPWTEKRDLFSKDLTHDKLDEVFNRLNENQIMIEEIYNKFPSKVITLEKDLPNEPYPNKYNYEGNWQPPYNFKMLGQ